MNASVNPATPEIPAHVPPSLVFDLDFWSYPEDRFDNPLDYWESIRRQGAPRIFYTPRNGGHWVFCDYETIREGYRNWELFSNFHAEIPYMENFPHLQPQGYDPPEHTVFRTLLAPLFTPVAVRRREEWIRALANSLLDAFAAEGHCEFVAQYSGKLPTAVSMSILGLPQERLSEFVALALRFFSPATLEEREAINAEIFRCLEEEFSNHEKHSGDVADVISLLQRARAADGQPFPRQEQLNCAFLLFIAGLHTVTATMSFIWHYLAQTPDARRYLIDNPDKQSEAMDELLRIVSVATLSRRVKADVEFHGVLLKANDHVFLPNILANRDQTVFDDPNHVHFDRAVNNHLTFGAGPHRCIGSILAKTEISIGLQEWMKRIPDFAVAPGTRVHPYAGMVMGMHALPLVWD